MIGLVLVGMLLIMLFFWWSFFKKQYVWLARSLGIFLIISGIIIFIYKTSVPHTDLSNEELGGVKLGAEIADSQIQPIEGNTLYVALKEQPDLHLIVKNHRVKELSTPFYTADESVQTQRGIGLGANFVEVVNQYGEGFRRMPFVEEFSTGITYYDRENNQKLSFYFDNDEEGSWLSYISFR